MSRYVTCSPETSTKIGYEKVVDEKGALSYTYNGKCHREDGPASITASGTKLYMRHGKLHREDGPAVIWESGRVAYYLDDILIEPSDYNLFSPLQLAKLGLI